MPCGLRVCAHVFLCYVWFLNNPVAVLMDTALYLERRYCRSLMILVSVSNNSKSTVIPLQSYSFFWSPLCLETVHITVDEPPYSRSDDNEQVSGQYALYCSLEKEPVAAISEIQRVDNKRHLIWTLK
jgi:hypothetical protein